MNGATFLKRLFQVWNINLDGTQEDLVFEQQHELVHDKSFITELFEFDSKIGILHVHVLSYLP